MAHVSVSDSFVPTATTSPLGVSPMSAQPVEPMRNAAPEQMQHVGAATQRLGMEINDIGERIQNQLSDALAKQAETKFLQQAMAITNGDGSKDNPGYMNLRGQNAVDGYNDAADALAKAKQAGLDGLSNDFQRQMYSRVASQHLLQFGKAMADHRFVQTSEYAAQASIERAQTYAQKAATSYSSYFQTDPAGQPAGDFYHAQQAAIAEGVNVANVKMGAPPGSDVSKAAVLKITSLSGQGALMQAMDDHAPFAFVQRMYDDMKAKGTLTVQTMDSMGKQVKSYVDGEQTRQVANQALANAQRASQGQPTTSTGTPDYRFAIKGAAITASRYDPDARGVEVAIPVNTAVQAPAAGTVTSTTPQEDGTPALKITHQNGSVTTLTGLNALQVKVGDKVQQGEDVALSGASGNQKAPSVFWSLSDPKGNAVDPTQAGLPPVDITRITDEKTLHAALDDARSQITDPKLQATVTSEIEGMVRHNQQMANAQTHQILQQANDAFFKAAQGAAGITNNTWRAIPPSVFSQLTSQQQYNFKTAGAKADSGGPEPQANFASRYWFATHPYFTQDDVVARAKDLTPSQVLEYAGTAAKRETSAEGKTATIDKMQLESSLQSAGLGALVHTQGQDTKTKIANQQRYVEIHDDVQNLFNAAQTAAKHPLGPDERKKILNDYLMNNQVFVHHAGFFSSSDKAMQYAAVGDTDLPNTWVDVGGERIRLSDIPQAQAQTIRQYLFTKGIPATAQNVAWWWKQNGK